MQLNKSLKLLSIITVLMTVTLPAHAITSTACNLGGACILKKNEEVYFIVTPRSGNNYQCDVTAEHSFSEFAYGIDGDYIIDNAPEYSVVKIQRATISYKGYFRYGNNNSQKGYLFFDNFPTSDDASVTCKAIN